MKQFLSLLVLSTMLLANIAMASAEDVYATKNGKKYHKEICEFIAEKNPHKITMEEAKAKHLEPCKKCYGQADKNSAKK